MEREHRAGHHAMLKDIRSKFEESLKTKRKTLRDLAKIAGSNDRQTLALKHQLEIDHQGVLKKELLDVKIQLMKARARVKMLEAQPPAAADKGALTEALIDEAINKDPGVQDYLEQIEQLANTLAKSRQTARTAKDPAILAAQERLKTAVSNLEKYRGKVRRKYESLNRERIRDERENALAMANQEIEVLVMYEKNLKEEVEKLSKDTRELNEATLDLESIKDEIKTAETAARQIASQEAQLGVELDAPPRIRLIEKAEAPQTPTR
jgi:hypothetical protein